jgi:hypothetical protein
MLEFRVTKYDPGLRALDGAYLRDDWTSVSDIGGTFDGVKLTDTEYKRVEDAYVESALAYLRESGVSFLVVRGLENHLEAEVTFGNGTRLSLEQIADTLPRMLREEFWCKLEGSDSFIHVGYDYYMYLGVPSACPTAEGVAANLGLFVESFRSPYGDLREALTWVPILRSV